MAKSSKRKNAAWEERLAEFEVAEDLLAPGEKAIVLKPSKPEIQQDGLVPTRARSGNWVIGKDPLASIKKDGGRRVIVYVQGKRKGAPATILLGDLLEFSPSSELDRWGKPKKFVHIHDLYKVGTTALSWRRFVKQKTSQGRAYVSKNGGQAARA